MINRRTFLKVGAAGAFIASGAGRAAFAAAESGTLRVAFAAGGPRNFDAAKINQGADAWTINHVYDRLVTAPLGRYPKSLDELQPSLALSWTVSEDARTWTFKLREGVQFQKGYGAMTSDDVKYSLERMLDPKRSGTTRAVFENIESIEPDGPYSVVFKLKRPDPLFPVSSLLGYSTNIMSRKAIEEKGEKAIEFDPIGTGPYQVEKVYENPADGVMLTANSQFWGQQPATPRIHFSYVADTTARTLALLSGDLDMIEGVRAPGWVPSLQQKQPGLGFDVSRPGSFFGMHVNLKIKPFDDLRVRQGIFYAIDRKEIADAMAPFGAETFGVNPPSFLGAFTAETIPADIRYNVDVDKSKALLAEAGLPNFTFDAYTSQREDYSSIALMIQEQLRRAGITMNLTVKEHTTFHANQVSGTNTLSMLSAAFPPVPTMPLLQYLSSTSAEPGGQNLSRYGLAMPGIDDKIEAALSEANLDKRLELVREAEAQVLRDAVYLPICTNGFLMVRRGGVELGYEVVSGGSDWDLTRTTIT
ncbi:ABC transporter substrate-binding protein [Mesorhizobium sp. BR1-1-16]|uniref:ABC transporter substrate-binding protein n=1 Tax=Mesorhizobium sp. BR1-1-16 TaxID=2876653 RepID=UPI001CCCCE58|nr:ABC transporter substrate-binding protein [Mesorhizobium sp. BR1-1-16]MBZ9938465.1 ABC transporter substrate-binding protein [Mesorhizobium sp. BR1-1-16]